MVILVVVILVIAAFLLWSANGAKTARRKYLQAHNNALVDRFQGKDAQPSWWNWRDDGMRSVVRQTVKPLVAESGYSPAAVELWLEADETWEDFLTFMAHAEKVGFQQAEQVALLKDFALHALNVDLSSERTHKDKSILLYMIAGTKQRNQQNIVEVHDFSLRVVADYLIQRGATVDDEVPEGHRFYDYTLDYRSVKRDVHMYTDFDYAQLTIYDNSPDPYRSFRPQPIVRR